MVAVGPMPAGIGDGLSYGLSGEDSFVRIGELVDQPVVVGDTPRAGSGPVSAGAAGPVGWSSLGFSWVIAVGVGCWWMARPRP